MQPRTSCYLAAASAHHCQSYREKPTSTSKMRSLAEHSGKKRRDEAYAKRRTHDLPQLNPGQAVSIQNPKGRRRWDKTGWIVHRKHEGRTYLVRFEDGAERYVNRIQLRPAQGGLVEHVLDQNVPDSEPPSAPPTVPAPAPEVRRSTRAGRGHKSCHSCAGCQKLGCPELAVRYKTRVFRLSG